MFSETVRRMKILCMIQNIDLIKTYNVSMKHMSTLWIFNETQGKTQALSSSVRSLISFETTGM
jgi:hypothetical protein